MHQLYPLCKAFGRFAGPILHPAVTLAWLGKAQALDGPGAGGKGAHAACEQIYFSSLLPRTCLRARLLEMLE
jgi:hypothetical protein